MSNLLSLENISLAFGLEPLLDNVKFQIASNERVCLIGRNGTGKSSLLKIIEGSMRPDAGNIQRKPNLRIARLLQELPQHSSGTVYEFVAEGLAETGKLLTDYYSLTHRMAHHHEPDDIRQLEELQHAIDTKNGWSYEQDINNVLNRLELDPDQAVAELSGGWQRRVALAKALVVAPELLLLDEPTNHLDIAAIEWLENRLLNTNVGIIFVTHDRSFLQRLATRIIELDRGQLTSWPGDYNNFLRRKEEMLHAEAKHHSEFDKKLAQEERWIRQGIKARRTRNEGRVRALKALRIERSQRREVIGRVSFKMLSAEQSGQLVIAAEQIGYHSLIKNFSLRIMRGERIGLVGPNGIGKSTLLNILLGKVAPEKGTVLQGTKLQIAYFDQLRQALDLEKSVIDNVAEGSDFIEYQGKKRHIISYLSDFLFSPQRSQTPVKALSGGERNRLLLARLFSKPHNLLVLDEPTNDLDIETLELLEELLSTYEGTLLLVSHDRAFLDNVVTSTLLFKGNGIIEEYVGGYHDFINQLKPTPTAKTADDTKNNYEKPKQQKKLSYKDQKELRELPTLIENLEAKHATLQELVATASFYQQAPDAIAQTMAELKQLTTDIEAAYKRWDELESIADN